jgi:hypothetical protein
MTTQNTLRTDLSLARSSTDVPIEEWEKHIDHVTLVATKLQQFAYVIGYPKLAYFIGLVHDIGKLYAEFQRRIQGEANDFFHQYYAYFAIQELFNIYLTKPRLLISIFQHQNYNFSTYIFPMDQTCQLKSTCVNLCLLWFHHVRIGHVGFQIFFHFELKNTADT